MVAAGSQPPLLPPFASSVAGEFLEPLVFLGKRKMHLINYERSVK